MNRRSNSYFVARLDDWICEIDDAIASKNMNRLLELREHVRKYKSRTDRQSHLGRISFGVWDVIDLYIRLVIEENNLK